MTCHQTILAPPGETTIDPVRRAWQEAVVRRAEIVNNETNVRVLILSGDTVLETRLLREIGHGAIATETTLETDPREITETETSGTTETSRVVQTAMSLPGNVIHAVRRLVHAPVVDRPGGHGARNAIAAASTADQSPRQTSGRPIHGEAEQNTGLGIPHLKSLPFLVTPIPTRLGLHPTLENKDKSPRQPPPRLTQLYDAMTWIMIRILWKISLVRYLRKVMMRALALFVHVAGAHTSPAPATSMPILPRNTILQRIFHRMMTRLRL
jgi:hypothetical protein